MSPAEPSLERKRRGGWYTPEALATWLLRWVLETRPATLLEPACGDGAFLRALAALPEAACIRHLLAVEQDPAEAARAREALPVPGEVRLADGLTLLADGLARPPDVDAVVGNPPFVRYQLLDDASQETARRLLEGLHLPFTRHVNLWVPFLVGCLHRLRPGGRLGLVVPAELLHVLHAQAARDMLQRTCARIVVVDPVEILFEGTLQGVVLLLAEARLAGGTAPAGVAVRSVRGADLPRVSAHDLVMSADLLPGTALPRKWMAALLDPAERRLLTDLTDLAARADDPTATGPIRRFDRVASVDVGIVTGANGFFLVPDATACDLRITPWCRPMFGRSEHVPGVVFTTADHAANQARGLPCWFVDAPAGPLPPPLQAWAASGERQGLHHRYKCRIRTPWYRVPSVWPAPVALLKRCHDLPRLVANPTGALTTDTAYRIRPAGVEVAPLVAGFVSSLTALSAELEGRHYGGGVLELVPSEIERLLLAVPPDGTASLAALDDAVRRKLPAEALLALRDPDLLGPAGLSSTDQVRLREAWLRLRGRRQRGDRSG